MTAAVTDEVMTMSDTTQQETKAQFAARLAAAVREALGGDAFPNPEGWRLDQVELRATRGGDARLEANVDPTFVFALPERTLALSVCPTDASRQAFHRTPRYDITYVAKGEANDRSIYEANQALIARFAAWVDSWDRGVPVAPLDELPMTEPTPPPPEGGLPPTIVA